jgi:hypothetical protein
MALKRLRSWRPSLLALILAAGLVHGLLYVFLVPPWQHYDEPTHFEYAWLAANRPNWPQPGDYDQAMRRQVAVSMLDHGFFKGLSYRPNLEAVSEPIWIGYSELKSQPAYYAVASLLLRLLHNADITLQLYAARLTSLLLYLISIALAWGLVAELVAAGSPLRWLVPTTMALLPGYVDLMTAVNCDAGAVAAFGLFLWGAIRLLLRRFTVLNLLWATGAALLCFKTKSTVMIAVPLLGLALLLAAARGRWRWPIAAGMAMATLSTVALSVLPGDADLWYRDTSQSSPTLARNVDSPVGDYALQLVAAPGMPPPRVFQLLPPLDVLPLRGKLVTVGAWVWATEPAHIQALSLYDYGRMDVNREADVTTRPVFVALSVEFPASASRPRVILEPLQQSAANPVTFFYAGLVVAEGKRPSDPPLFDGPGAASGAWGGQPFQNLVRNGSPDAAWVAVHPRVAPLFDRVFPLYVPPTLVLNSLLDWPASGSYYTYTAQDMVRTFWAKFGWGHVPLMGQQPYLFLGVVTAAGLLGAVIIVARRWQSLTWAVLALLTVTLVGVWGQAMVKGLQTLLHQSFIPGARYAYPAIVPSLLVLVAGWWELMRLAGGPLRLSQPIRAALFVGLFVLLDVFAITSLLVFYANQAG